jgi:hypothetical protein
MSQSRYACAAAPETSAINLAKLAMNNAFGVYGPEAAGDLGADAAGP